MPSNMKPKDRYPMDRDPATQRKQITLRALRDDDADTFQHWSDQLGWHKPSGLFRRYAEEHDAGSRWVCVAELKGEFAGYVTVLWTSMDSTLRDSGIPEIVDLNVLPAYRCRGVGTALLDAAEVQVASRSDIVGIRVGLHSGYGSAQRLYVARGYLPDGAGAVIHGESAPEGATVQLDDELALRMTKTVRV